MTDSDRVFNAAQDHTSSSGIADDSIGGTYNTSNTQSVSGSSIGTSEGYGTQSAGYDNNIERTGGEESGSKGGVKGVLGKIKDKLAPSGKGQSTHVDENEAVKNSFGGVGAGADAGKELRTAQANTDLNRE